MVDKQQTADEDLASLRTQVDDSKKRVADLEQASAAVVAENDKLRTEAVNAINARVKADETTAVAAIAAASQEIANLKQQFATALAAGDAGAAADATLNLASAQNRIDQWSGQKTRIDNWKKQQVAAAEQAIKTRGQQQPQQQQQYSPKTKAWLDKHPEVANDQRKMQKAFGAHNIAVADGLTPDTDEYFKVIEGQLGMTADAPVSEAGDMELAGVEVDLEEKPETTPRLERTPNRREVDQAAAPSRATARVVRNDNPGRIRLTGAEQDAARASFPHLKTDAERFREYAKNKAALIQEGRLQA